MKQLEINKIDPTNDKISNSVRCSLRVPIDLSIKMDMVVSTLNRPKTWWMIEAIKEKLDRDEGNDRQKELGGEDMKVALEEIKHELLEIHKKLEENK